MAYRTIDENRVPSGIVFFGPTAADQTFESNSSLVFDSGTQTLYVENLNVNGTLAGAAGAITVSGDLGISQEISHGDTLLILGGTSLTSTGSDTDTITISVDDGGIGNTQLADGSVTEGKISRSVGSYNATANIVDDIVLATAGSAGITLTLPSAASGLMVVVKKVDDAEGNVTIAPAAGSIDGASTRILYYQYESMNFVSDSTDWYVI